MTPIQFRYDFADDEQTKQPMSVIGEFIQERYPGIFGVESHNKYGEVIKRHMHYNFLHPSDDSVEIKKFLETVRKRFQRAYPGRTKGYYSITSVPDVKDMDRWFRYCLKQYENFNEVPCIKGFPRPEGFDLETQWKLATEEYIRDREFLSSRREAKDRRQTTYEKIRALIEEEQVQFKSIRDIFNYILKYYKQEMLPVERHKIRSMVDSIALHTGLMTEDEYYRQVMS